LIFIGLSSAEQFYAKNNQSGSADKAWISMRMGELPRDASNLRNRSDIDPTDLRRRTF